MTDHGNYQYHILDLTPASPSSTPPPQQTVVGATAVIGSDGGCENSPTGSGCGGIGMGSGSSGEDVGNVEYLLKTMPTDDATPHMYVKTEEIVHDECDDCDDNIVYDPQHLPPPPLQNRSIYGRLSYKDEVLFISDNMVEIGRNSSTSSVQFHVGRNSFVSRKHLQIIYDTKLCDFYLVCLSKNGVFVNDVFQRKSSDPLKLSKTCNFRFPSTNIQIQFESYGDSREDSYEPKPHPTLQQLHQQTAMHNNSVRQQSSSPIHSPPPPQSNSTNLHHYQQPQTLIKPIKTEMYSPLKITIPAEEKKSPFPSPTGTISAANSCPASPRQCFQDYHSYNYNNNNNFQNELFQPPSTSSYNEHEKPPYSYAQLIVQSISASLEKQLTLSGIYSFISKNYPYYRKEANKGWQNSIRHNLSLNRYFIKVARSQDEPGKGSFWRIDPQSEAKLIDQSFKKRRQRGSQCFRMPYGMPRSAPVSPSHIDNSRESSPLHDIMMQSAPGSPGVSYHNNSNSNNDDVSSNHRTIIGVQSPYASNSNQYNISSTSTTATSAYCSHSAAATLKRQHRMQDIYEDHHDDSDDNDSSSNKRHRFSDVE